jgi:hypothetical protein
LITGVYALTSSDVIGALGATPLYVSDAQTTPAANKIPIAYSNEGVDAWAMPRITSVTTTGTNSNSTSYWSAIAATAYVSGVVATQSSATAISLKFEMHIQGTANAADTCSFALFQNSDTSSPLLMRSYTNTNANNYWTVSGTNIGNNFTSTDTINLRVKSTGSATCTIQAGSTVLLERRRP